MSATSDAKKAFLVATRAYQRAEKAKTCALAQTNLRLGQQAFYRGMEAWERAKKLLGPSARHWTPEQHELVEIKGLLAAREWYAHENRLKRCGITQREYERAYWEDRARSEDAADRAMARQDRKRPKKRR